MIKKYLLVFLFTIPFLAGCEDEAVSLFAVPGSLKQSPGLPNVDPVTLLALTDKIDEPSTRTILEQLTGVLPVSLSTGSDVIEERGSTEGRNTARRYIYEQFSSFGLETNLHSFVSSTGKTGENVEALIRGTSEGKHLFVTAHFDSANNPGADDNASGVVSLLQAAKALAGQQVSNTIHFVAFDLEEVGLIGSYYYVQDRVLSLDRSKVIGNYNADMVGHDDGQHRAVFADCGDAPTMVDVLQKSIEALDLSINSATACAGGSDHVRFSDQGIGAVYLTDDFYYGAYPWYHQSSDTADRLDTVFLNQISKAITAAAFSLAAGA